MKTMYLLFVLLCATTGATAQFPVPPSSYMTITIRTDTSLTIRNDQRGITSFIVTYHTDSSFVTVPVNSKEEVLITYKKCTYISSIIPTITYDANPITQGVGINTCATSLPLNFISFTAAAKNGFMELAWEIGKSEEDIASYDVEKSIDGKKFTFENTLAVTKGKKYSLLTSLGSGKQFYRVKQNYRNGTISYSPILRWNNTASSKITIYPNPASDYIILHSTMISSKATIFTVHGTSMLEVFITGNSQKISISTLPKGTYLLLIPTKNGIESKYFIKQ